MGVAARDLGVARLARRGRVAQKVSDVVLVYVRRPESLGEGVPKVVEVEIVDSRLLDRPLEADHQLPVPPPRPRRIEDQLVVVGRVLTQTLEDCERQLGQGDESRFVVPGLGDGVT